MYCAILSYGDPPDQEVGHVRARTLGRSVSLSGTSRHPLLNQADLLTCSHILMRPYLHAAVIPKTGLPLRPGSPLLAGESNSRTATREQSGPCGISIYASREPATICAGRRVDRLVDSHLATPPGRALAALAGDTRFEESAASVATRGTSCHALPAFPRAARAKRLADIAFGCQTVPNGAAPGRIGTSC
jgi:hypothetical protein